MAGLLISTCYRTYGATVHPATPVRRTNECLLMISALTLLLVYQLVGEVIAQFFALPVPGPVIGMGLLFATLAVRGAVSDELRGTANGLLQHLSLLFVPAGTGVMLHFGRLADEWLALLASLLVSTAVTIAVSALLMRLLMARGSADVERES
jgi:holin-like protein